MCSPSVILFWMVSMSSILRTSCAEYHEVLGNLTHFLMDPYDARRIPLKHRNHPVNVSLYMWPYDILYVNEAKSSIKISDQFLKWDPAKYENISEIFLQSSQIWLPYIDIFYSKEEGAKVEPCDECYVRVTNNGSVLRGMYFSYSFPCKINVKYFPFDRQSCDLEVANWFLNEQVMDLYPKGDIDLTVFLTNEEWDLESISASRVNNFYNYARFPSLRYQIRIRRKPFYYICNLIMPSLIITITAVIGFHMPSTSSGIHQEKAKMGLTAILSIFILQLGISDKMPRTSDVVPLINVFYFCLVLIVSLAIISTSVIILVEKQALFGKPVPLFAQKLFLCSKVDLIAYLASVICGQSKHPTDCVDDTEKTNQTTPVNTTTTTTTEASYLLRSRPLRKHNTDLFVEACGSNCSNGHLGSDQRKYQLVVNTGRCSTSPIFQRAKSKKNPQQHRPAFLTEDCRPQRHLTTPDHNEHSWEPSTSTFDSSPRLDSGTSETPASNLPKNNHLGCSACISVLSGLKNGVSCLYQEIQAVDSILKEQRSKQAVRSEWMQLADAIERTSLRCFLIGIGVSVLIFVFHGWY